MSAADPRDQPDMFHVKRSPSAAQIAWAAGIFEGEGSVVRVKTRGRLQLKMTDEDVMQRFTKILGGNLTGPYRWDAGDGTTRKQYWCWSANGENAISIARLLAPWLGDRRRGRLVELGCG